MLKKPLVIGAIALAVVIIIVVGILVVPKLFKRPASPDLSAQPTETAVAGQSTTSEAPTETAAPTADSGDSASPDAATSTPSTGDPAATRAAPAASGDLPGPAAAPIAELRKTGNLREGPGTDMAVLAVLDAGTRVRILEMNPSKQWARVITAGSQEGWVYDGNLERIR